MSHDVQNNRMTLLNHVRGTGGFQTAFNETAPGEGYDKYLSLQAVARLGAI